MNNNESLYHPNVLLVEDNSSDILLVQEAVKEMKLNWQLWVVPDALKAQAFLHQEETFGHVPHPQLILLDLNLPKKQGLLLLDEIKQDPELKKIPVIILSASSWDIDILKTYSLHANCYLIKPIQLDHFMKIIKGINDFWFELVKLPSNV